MKSLQQIAEALRVALPSEALFSLVNARVTLRTGVDLSRPDLATRDTPQSVAEVLGALSALGYSQETLQLVAQRGGNSLRP